MAVEHADGTGGIFFFSQGEKKVKKWNFIVSDLTSSKTPPPAREEKKETKKKKKKREEEAKKKKHGRST